MIKNEEQPAVALEQLSKADFEPLKGKAVSVFFSAEGAEEAVLADVVPLTGYSNLDRKPFSIVLQTGQQKQWYPQAIYTLVHPVLGAMDLFLVPLGMKDGGMQYEAVFS